MGRKVRIVVGRNEKRKKWQKDGKGHEEGCGD